ncbi:Cation/H+ exchanger [Syncephalastrum racemosum]|uniref:Cation/H+ exchanger n=1 Tax=Syncephalastrum racemosum TaxID=13706 RepID=A0A1X2HAX9_SYNRA|nr:Cation/H+ exchanger [Syncephalastrum racemosum]
MSVDETVSCIAAVFGGFILCYGLCSLVIKERLYISEASVAVLCGILVGPYGFKLVVVDEWVSRVDFTREFCRLVIAIQVMAAGVALPKAYLRKEGLSLLVLLGPVMGWMWLASAACVYYVIPKLTFLESLMIASCFTPTDPVLANSIVQGHFAEKYVPAHVRNIISAESGANDGLGYPFLFLALLLMRLPTHEALTTWFLDIILYDIVYAALLGFAAGYIARVLLRYAQEKNLIDNESFLVYAVALALFLMGTVSLLGSDDLLACFIAGNSFTWDDWFRVRTEESHLMATVDMLLNLSIFIYIGCTMPWSSFVDTTLGLSIQRLLFLALLVHLFRRVPVITALYKWIPAIRTWREAAFSGWFGPMGVGSVFYAMVALEQLDPQGPHAYARELMEPVVYFIAFTSIIVHGVTIPLFFMGKLATQSWTDLPRTRFYVNEDSNESLAFNQSMREQADNLSTYGALSIYSEDSKIVCNE